MIADLCFVIYYKVLDEPLFALSPQDSVISGEHALLKIDLSMLVIIKTCFMSCAPQELV